MQKTEPTTTSLISWYDWIPGFLEPAGGKTCLVSLASGKTTYAQYVAPKLERPFWQDPSTGEVLRSSDHVVAWAHKPLREPMTLQAMKEKFGKLAPIEPAMLDVINRLPQEL